MKLANLTACVLGIAVLTSCGSKENASIPPKPTPVVEVAKMSVPIIAEFPGQVYGIQDIPIRARVEGFLEEMTFNEGSTVEKGKLLYTIDPLPYQARLNSAQSKLAQAKTNEVKTKSDLDRIRPLAERNAVSRSDLDAAVAQYEAAVASVEAAKAEVDLAKIELGYARISSPITGVIGKTEAREGEYVGRSPNPVILNTVSRIDSFRVEFFIPEAQFIGIMRNQREQQREGKEGAKFSIVLADGSLFNVEGSFDFLDRAVDRSTGSIRAQVLFPNEDQLIRPGQFVKLRISFDNEKEELVVPSRSIGDLQGEKFVFVLNDENVAERRFVEVGRDWTDLRVIKSGLEQGDKIILEGIQAAGSGAAIQPVDTTFTSVNGVEL